MQAPKSHKACLSILSKKFKKELVKLYASFELCLSRLAWVYLAKNFKEELAELYASLELCPENLAQLYLAKF